MEERKLNLNAPLLSVRRCSTASSSSSIVEDKRGTENSICPIPTELRLEQVTEPVAVPFHWEFIPGRSKNSDDEPESKLSPPHEGTPITPRLQQNLTGEDERKIGPENEPQNKDFEMNPMETQSSSDSLSVSGCSVSGLSGSDGPEMKPCGTFSVDHQTLDFMMRRFLPAAKALAISTHNYASRKQITAVRQLQEPSIQEMEPIMATQDIEIKKKEERDVGQDDWQDSCTFLTKNRNLLHGSCPETSKELLHPSLELTIRPRTTVSPVFEVQKLAIEKSYVRSQSPNLRKFFHERKLEGEVGSPKLPELINSITDLKTRGRLSPFRRSKGALTNRIENSQPLEGPHAKIFDSHRKSVAKFGCSGEGNSDFRRPGIDRTCADSLNKSEIASSILNFSDLKKVKFISDRTENRTVMEEKRQTLPVESHSQQPKPEAPVAGESVLPESLSSMINKLPEQVSKSLEYSKSGNGYKVEHGAVEDEIDSSSVWVLHRPPPVPKTPRESWLARTLPSISSETRSNFGSQRRSKNQNEKEQSTETPKWERMVKTSNRHIDRVRYSEELVARIHLHSNS